MSRLTFARSAGAAGPKMTDVGYIYIYIYIYIDRQTDRQTGGALNSQGGTRSRSPQLVNAEHYGRAGANPPSLTVRDHVYTCRLVPCFISFFPQLNCHHGHVTVPVDIGILLLYIYNYAHLVFNEIT